MPEFYYRATVFGSNTYTIKSAEPLSQLAIEEQARECWNEDRHTMGGTVQDAIEISANDAGYIDVDLTEE